MPRPCGTWAGNPRRWTPPANPPGCTTVAPLELGRAHQVGTKRLYWPFPSGDRLIRCRLLSELDSRLPAFLEGEAKPADVDGRIPLAYLYRRRARGLASARLYEESFGER